MRALLLKLFPGAPKAQRAPQVVPLAEGLWLSGAQPEEAWDGHLAYEIYFPHEYERLARFESELARLLSGGLVRLGVRSESLPEAFSPSAPSAGKASDDVLQVLAREREAFWRQAGTARLRRGFLWLTQPLLNEKALAENRLRELQAVIANVMHALGIVGAPLSREEACSAFYPKTERATEAWAVALPPPDSAAFEVAPYFAEALSDAEQNVRGAYWAWATYRPATLADQARIYAKAERVTHQFWRANSLRAKCRQLLAWREAGHSLAQISVEVQVDQGLHAKKDTQLLQAALHRQGYQRCHTATQAKSFKAQLAQWRPVGDSPQHWPLVSPGLARRNSSSRGGIRVQQRDGRLETFDPFQSDADFNVVIAGSAGSGKRYLAKNLLLAKLQEGQRAWIINTHANFSVLQDVTRGQRITLDAGQSRGLNPFSLIAGTDDLTAYSGLLVQWLLTLAGEAWPLQVSEHLRRLIEYALYKAWQEKSATQSFDWRDILRYLKGCPEPAAQEFTLALEAQHATRSLFEGTAEGLFPEAPLVIWDISAYARTPMESLVVQTLLLMATIHWRYHAGPSIQKMLLLDELDFRTNEGVPFLVEAVLRQARMLNASIVTTCSTADMLERDPPQQSVGRCLIGHAAHCIFLRSACETIFRVAEAQRWPAWVQREAAYLHTSRESSQFLVRGPNGDWQWFRLQADRLSHGVLQGACVGIRRYWAYREEGMSPEKALRAASVSP